MHIDGPATVLALPPDLLPLHELPYSVFFDAGQVLDHAHVILRSVAFVQSFETLAWEPVASTPAVLVPGVQLVTIGDNALSAVSGLFLVWVPAANTMVLLSKMGHADATVHSAGCDELCLHRLHYRGRRI